MAMRSKWVVSHSLSFAVYNNYRNASCTVRTRARAHSSAGGTQCCLHGCWTAGRRLNSECPSRTWWSDIVSLLLSASANSLDEALYKLFTARTESGCLCWFCRCGTGRLTRKRASVRTTADVSKRSTGAKNSGDTRRFRGEPNRQLFPEARTIRFEADAYYEQRKREGRR